MKKAAMSGSLEIKSDFIKGIKKIIAVNIFKRLHPKKAKPVLSKDIFLTTNKAININMVEIM